MRNCINNFIKSSQNDCPELGASILSRFFFLWTNKVVERANKNDFNEKKLWDINPRETCDNVFPTFDKNLTEDTDEDSLYDSIDLIVSDPSDPSGMKSLRRRKCEKVSKNENNAVAAKRKSSSAPYRCGHHYRNLWVVLMKTFWKEFFTGQIYRISEYVLVWITNPYFIGLLMDQRDNPETSLWSGFLLSSVFLVLQTLSGLMVEHTFFNKRTVQMHIRSSLMTAVYRKAMNLHTSARSRYSIGKMTNYMSADCDNITYHLTHLSYVILTPLHLIVVFYQLFNILGTPASIGVFACALLVPFNVYVAKLMRILYDESAKRKDDKMKILNEVLTGIKVLKLNAWEKCFGDKVDMARERELEMLRKYYLVRALSTFSWTVSPFMISVAMFCGFYYLNDVRTLTAKSAFSVVSLLNLLRYGINQAPEIIFNFTKVNISIERLQKFLNENEYSRKPSESTSSNVAITIRNGSFAWNTALKNTLQNINLVIPKGKLVAVIGHLGSGKSTLLSAVLNEVEKVTGSVDIQGTIAYVSQQAWIQNDTLQNNILFGKDMDRQLYRKVIQACDLQPDLDLLPAGDQSEIGERGINLSGGQKQRVSLARAVYNDADIYLLDDPLSAVDSQVGKHIFDKLISNKGLLRNKTRVLVTHNFRYIQSADNIIVLHKGRVVQSGSFSQLLISDDNFNKIIKSRSVYSCSEDIPEISSQNTTSKRRETDTTGQSLSETDVNSGKYLEEEDYTPISEKTQWILLLRYIKSFGPAHMFFVCILYGLYHILLLTANIMLVWWTEDSLVKDDGLENKTLRRSTNIKYLCAYTCLGIVMTLCILLFSLSMTNGVLRACKTLHHDMLTRVLRSPMKFFDTTPIGRITNRFSHDINIVDEGLPHCIEGYLDCIFNISISLIAVVYSTPLCLVIFLPLVSFYT